MKTVLVYGDLRGWELSSFDRDDFTDKQRLERAKFISEEGDYAYGVMDEQDWLAELEPEYIFIRGVQYRQYPEKP
jgi:hypothetical protein